MSISTKNKSSIFEDRKIDSKIYQREKKKKDKTFKKIIALVKYQLIYCRCNLTQNRKLEQEEKSDYAMSKMYYKCLQ